MRDMKACLALMVGLMAALPSVDGYATEVIDYRYDDLGRLIQVEHDDGSVVQYEFDEISNRTHESERYIANAPFADDDAYSVSEDTPLVIAAAGVLANDSNPILEAGALSAVLVTATTAGVLELFADGAFTYTPDADFQGEDRFTYLAENALGVSRIATVTLTVNGVNDAPVGIGDNVITAEDTSRVIDVLANDVDIEGDPLSIQQVDARSAFGGSISGDGTALMYTPAADFFGVDTFTYRVMDNAGAVALSATRVTVEVTAVNDPPHVQNETVSGAEDTPVLVDVLSNDSDIDSPGDLILSALTQPSQGSVVMNGVTVEYTPRNNYFGDDLFGYTVVDSQGGTASGQVTVTITAVNDPPVAHNDGVNTDADTAVVIGVLDNDTDVDGDSLTLVGFDTATVHQGRVSREGDSLLYTPATSYVGQDRFRYAIEDPAGEVATAEVTINVAFINDPPQSRDDAAVTDEDIAVLIDVLANDTDIDSPGALTIIAVTHGSHGTTAISDQQIVYTPAADYAGVDTFSYTISDGLGAVSSATVVVTVAAVNDPPQAQPDRVDTLANTAVTMDVLSNDTDIESHQLSVTTVTDGAHGTAGIIDGRVIYTPNLDYTGIDTFSYDVSDELGALASATVTVQVDPDTGDLLLLSNFPMTD
ncbi:MAG: hypothetical protein DHS20C01_37840 [marine bacterium B5-7]|nr:MAG: hypothetical protein DHS20C01_37840 [marine bacterium B5-7]